MWEVLGELARTLRAALRDWSGTVRLLCVVAAVSAAVLTLR
jgi:hypothetical protein